MSETGSEQIGLTAKLILQEFDKFYAEYCEVPDLAKQAFEKQNHQESIRLSSLRLGLYSKSLELLGAELKATLPLVSRDENTWRKVERHYMPMVQDRYAADIAIAYIHSVRRIIYQGEWRPVEYSFGSLAKTATKLSADVLRRFIVVEEVTTKTVSEILKIPNFSSNYRNLSGDAALVTQRLNLAYQEKVTDPQKSTSIEIINAGFYRNRGAYIVGRLVDAEQIIAPVVVALLNNDEGIYIDAVLTEEADAHNIFSSTLANFHVTHPSYHELAVFLHSIMPQRPLGLHYSSIGYNHLGKVAIMNELKEELFTKGEVFETAIGFKGTVAIGFSAPSSVYNLKVIRNHPTEQYKWGKFDGVESVLAKYARVHEINRTGSMLDNVIYYNLKLDASWFDVELLEELLQEAGDNVDLQGDAVIFKYLIVQRRVTPLPVFLKDASKLEARTVIRNLGWCIKNNTAANIFNKDLDARNYGVSRYLKVYLFDYDALEPFTEVKIRSNVDRIDGEEDLPNWVFEKGVIFLPEELAAGLCIPGRELQYLFKQEHGDLLTVEYWERIQNELRDEQVPSLKIYSDNCRVGIDKLPN